MKIRVVGTASHILSWFLLGWSIFEVLVNHNNDYVLSIIGWAYVVYYERRYLMGQ